MIYPIILGLHITAACITGAVGAYALFALRYNMSNVYRLCALALGFIAAFEVFSGSVLAFLSPELSAVSLSLHIAVYLGACLALESLLFVRMQKSFLAFPSLATVSPVLASLGVFALAISFGF